LWLGIIAAAIATQLVGWLGRKPHLMLSHHMGARMHQGVVVLAFMLIFWLVWHWGIGRQVRWLWVDLAFVAAGAAYWWVSYRYPLPW
jgi:hypothetical protein